MIKKNAAKKTKSRRPRKPDRITNPESIGNVTHESIYHSLRPLDEMVHQMEKRWGVDRLPSLVESELAARFGAAKAKLDAAIDENEPAEVQKRVRVMMKGWKTLSDAAEKAGAAEISAGIWEGRADSGVKYAFCRTDAEAHLAAKERKDYRVFSVAELVRLLEARYSNLMAAKRHFPGATVEKVRQIDDEIPF